MVSLKAEPFFSFKLGSWACLCVDGEAMTICKSDEVKVQDNFAFDEYVGPLPALKGNRRISRANSSSSEVSAVSHFTARRRPSGLPDSDNDGDESLPTLLHQPSVRRFYSTISQAEQAAGSVTDPVQDATKSLTGRRLRFSINGETLSRVDFNGRWLLNRIDGDFEAFLTDIGTSWMLRKMAKGVNYGVGKSIQDITIKGDEFTVITEGGPKVTTLTMHIGGGEEESVGLDGEPVLVRVRWEGSTLVMESRKPDPDGTTYQPTRRYLDGEEMVVENTTTSGLVVKRFFAKEA